MGNSDSDIAIRVHNLSKAYKLYPNAKARLKEALHPFRKKYHQEFYALKNLSFKVKKGEVIGIIGKNGSGKSTLLKIISGVLQPTNGNVQVNGNLLALLEIGSGFNPEFTGIENVFFYGSIMGFERNVMEAKLDEILSFADIGDFVYQPVKTYSSGMNVRLGFAVQACLQPNVLIVDEVLGVGDIFFQQKCHARMEELIAKNTTVVIVTHSMEAVLKYSNSAILLDQGNCLFMGDPNETVQRYYALKQRFRPEPQNTSPTLVDNSKTNLDNARSKVDDILDWPEESAFLDLSQAVVIGEENVARSTGIAICNMQGEPCTVFQIGEMVCFFYEFELLQNIEVPLGGVNITNKMNIVIHAKNSLQHAVEAPPFVLKGSRVRFRQSMELNVASGEYTFTVSLATLNAEDYAHAMERDYDHFKQEIRSILRVRQAGKILVKRKLALPFYGYVDLKGESKLSIITHVSDAKTDKKTRGSLQLPKNSFYLISYPRSGNTWLLYSLSMLFNGTRSVARSQYAQYPHLYGSVGHDTFYLKAEDHLNASRPLILKSHETRDIYERLYLKTKCIYIFRDGRDALLSYYFYNKAFSVKEQMVVEKIGKKQDLTTRTLKSVEFEPEEFGIFLKKNAPEWADHVEKWLEADNIFSLSYEDLSRNFTGMLTEIIDYLGIEPCLSVSDVKTEYVDEFKQFFSGDNRQFFRKGIVGDWKNYYMEDHIRIFSELAGDLLIKLGYEPKE